MKLYFEAFKMLWNRFIRRMSTGEAIKIFAQNMGLTYIKFAQMLAMQNIGNIFTEEDRQVLCQICDHCENVDFSVIKEIIEKDYHKKIEDVFASIEETSVGAASISQVHKAVLKNGDVVAVKVKRNDVACTVEKDVQTIRKLVNRFSGLTKFFGNVTGGNRGLDLWLDWIYQEIDFNHERENIESYSNFAASVNGKVDTKDIKVPKLYSELCTDNVLVMEFISSKTINQMELTEVNKERIQNAINDYIKASFYALLNDQKVIFHGDPHGGNIYIDDNDNIGFLDMGLIFEISEEDKKMARKLFFSIYLGKVDEIYQFLLSIGDLNLKQKSLLRKDVEDYFLNVKTKSIPDYYVGMILICVKYNIKPPDILFCMAKAFVCLEGITTFSDNMTSAIELLEEQLVDFYIKRTVKDTKEVIKSLILFTGAHLYKTSSFMLEKGISKGFKKGVVETIKDATHNCEPTIKEALENYKEILLFMGTLFPEEEEDEKENSYVI